MAHHNYNNSSNIFTSFTYTLALKPTYNLRSTRKGRSKNYLSYYPLPIVVIQSHLPLSSCSVKQILLPIATPHTFT